MKDTKKTKSVFKKIIISLVLCPVVIYVILTILRLIVSFPLWFAETAEVDGWEITYNKLLNSAFVDCYFADPDEEDFEITVPDEYNGMPVTKFGHSSLVPVMPFNIDLSELYMNAPESSIYDSYFTKDIIVSHTDGEFFCIENVVFKLYIGKNIKEIKDVDMDYYYPHINEDGSITFYHPVVEIYCSEENKHFYSEDGRLYKRSNGELITDFSYAE